jgi:hypothetical protein
MLQDSQVDESLKGTCRLAWRLVRQVTVGSLSD